MFRQTASSESPGILYRPPEMEMRLGEAAPAYFNPSARYRSESVRMWLYTYDFPSGVIQTLATSSSPVAYPGCSSFQSSLFPVARSTRNTRAGTSPRR